MTGEVLVRLLVCFLALCLMWVWGFLVARSEWL